jgi:type IV secretion system protein VirB11
MNQASNISDIGLKAYLEPISKLLNEDGVTEVMINRPGEAFVERYGDMYLQEIPAYSFNYLIQLTNLIASYSNQFVNDSHPLLSAVLPDGERVQVVRPPACEPGIVAMSIRKPSSLQYTLKDYSQQEAFAHTTFYKKEMTDEDLHLLELKKSWNIEEFIRQAIRYRKNIVLSGGTSSGKTTFLNAMVKEIPLSERIITIEDVRETRLDHRNKVHLLYSKGGQGMANVSAADLLQVCLRMRPDRILPSEIRGAEAFDFLEAVNSGHPGSMTSMHANSALEAEQRLIFMCLRANTGMTKDQLSDYINSVIDIIIQFERQNGKRVVTDIWYEPHK